MKRVTGIFEGMKIGIEETQNKDGKTFVSFYLLSGHDSIRMSVRDNELLKKLKIAMLCMLPTKHLQKSP